MYWKNTDNDKNKIVKPNAHNQPVGENCRPETLTSGFKARADKSPRLVPGNLMALLPAESSRSSIRARFPKMTFNFRFELRF